MSLPDLTRQQRNMARLAPLMKLDQQKNTVLRTIPETVRAQVDLKQAILFLLDYVMVQSGLGLGAEPAEVKAAVTEAMRVVAPVSEEQAAHIADTVHGWLLQPDERTAVFREDYFDCAEGMWKFEEFRYLRIVVDEVSGRPLLRLGDAGAIVHIGMLDLDDSFAAEIEAEIIRRAIARGRFDDAVEAAKRALKRSQKYRADLIGYLVQARRSLDGGNWVDNALPLLEEARRHLEERQRDDQAVVLAVADKIASLDDDPASLAKAVRVRELVADCRRLHAALFIDVCEANETFRAFQTRAFAVRRVEDLPDPEDDVLRALLRAPIGRMEELAPVIGAAFAAPTAPGLLNLPRFWGEIADEAAAEDLEGDGADAELQPLDQLPPLYEEGFIRDLDGWLVERAALERELPVDRAVRLLRTERSAEAARCAVLLFLHHYQDGTPGRASPSAPLLVFRGEGPPWRVGAMGGGLLSLRPRAAVDQKAAEHREGRMDAGHGR
ncbi:hypothetical protein [Azospirillum canadense]|uniref:hypothetical protein n=1 Tax=Azospirillum canadense TaxID=403962 RepID=UPI002225E2EB|nr:hypothetical protein [Azospirillum canadense]MCW2241765.1 hypothetical protein [Azospirillum canadense]